MRILLDECVDRRLAGHISGHTVFTVAECGWSGITNGKLLSLVQTEFDIFLTTDRNMSFQQNLPKFDLAVVLLVSKWNRINDLIALVPELLQKLPSAAKGSVTQIGR